jgi:hypothetical protein
MFMVRYLKSIIVTGPISVHIIDDFKFKLAVSSSIYSGYLNKMKILIYIECNCQSQVEYCYYL